MEERRCSFEGLSGGTGEDGKAIRGWESGLGSRRESLTREGIDLIIDVSRVCLSHLRL
jgi:hypothetical protein